MSPTTRIHVTTTDHQPIRSCGGYGDSAHLVNDDGRWRFLGDGASFREAMKGGHFLPEDRVVGLPPPVFLELDLTLWRAATLYRPGRARRAPSTPCCRKNESEVARRQQRLPVNNPSSPLQRASAVLTRTQRVDSRDYPRIISPGA